MTDVMCSRFVQQAFQSCSGLTVLRAQEEKKAEGATKPENAEAMDTDANAAAPEAMDAGEEGAAGAGPQPTSVEEPMEQ